MKVGWNNKKGKDRGEGRREMKKEWNDKKGERKGNERGRDIHGEREGKG